MSRHAAINLIVRWTSLQQSAEDQQSVEDQQSAIEQEALQRSQKRSIGFAPEEIAEHEAHAAPDPKNRYGDIDSIVPLASLRQCAID